MLNNFVLNLNRSPEKMPQVNLYETIHNQFPFISVVQYGANADEYVGIVQNADSLVVGFYDFGLLTAEEDKKLFLTLGERWYYESNRQLPINIYLKSQWSPFQRIFRTFISKELTVIHGPTTSLAALGQKKKRRSITVVKKF